MSEDKRAYLQMLQEPICRMSTISAIFKGFAATIVAGISVISYSTTNIWVLGLSFLPVFAFAILDIYYLKLERKFRFLFDQVRLDKHDDLDDLKGLLGFLEQEYGVKVYIDSRDPSMPKITSAQTALNIRERIKGCDKFILLATNGAIKSKWCNWELGYGDAQKFKKHIALYPIKPQGSQNNAYKGSEYMNIYPHIVFFRWHRYI